MHIGPIISSLRRHRIAAVLIVLEIAMTCAIVSNAVFLIRERLSQMSRTSGIVESELVRIQLAGIRENTDAIASTKRDLDTLRSLDGVKSVAAINQVPFGNSSWNSDFRLEPDTPNGINVSTYLGSEDALETFGLRLIAGRDFNRDEYVDLDTLRAAGPEASIPSVIMAEALAKRLFPGESAVGKKVYSWGSKPMVVVGVVEHLIRPGRRDPISAELSVLMPVRPSYGYGARYFLRVDEDRRGELLETAVTALEANDPNRIVLDQSTYEDIRAEYFENDRAMAWLLIAVCIALLIITGLGIVGLASFWVQQRTRQIGIRRALGANQSQILRYFQMENFILCSFGIVVGITMAYGINAILMDRYELARLPFSYIPIATLALYVVCQIAVLGPALRASRVPPAVATRGV